MTGLPIADTPFVARAARRLLLIRAVLTGALALLIAAAITIAADNRAATKALATSGSGRTTEVVLDLSGSVSRSSFAVALQTLNRLARGSAPVGLILFSDAAQETLPPGTSPAQLRPFLRALSARRRGQAAELSLRPPDYAPNPWYTSFTGGTRISAGLAAARQALERDLINGRVLLISDLGDAPNDRARLTHELIVLARSGIDLHVLALPNTLRRDKRWFEKFEGSQSVQAKPPVTAAVKRSGPGSESVSLALVAVAGLLALALAANELFATSLRWRTVR